MTKQEHLLLDPRVIDLLERVIAAMQKAGIPYAIGGGIAVIAHGVQRTTVDVDLFVRDQERARALRALRDVGLLTDKVFEPAHYLAFDPKHNDPRIRVDVLVPFDDPELGAIEYPQLVRIGDTPDVHVFPAELLVMSKFYTDPNERPDDRRDIHRLLREGAFEPETVRILLAGFDPEAVPEWTAMIDEMTRKRTVVRRPRGRIRRGK
jgi:hypothetical protein